MKITEFHQSNTAEHEVSMTKAEQLDELLLFFRENPSASRADFLALDKALQVSVEELEALEFELCKSLCSKLGRHVNHGKEPFDAAQIEKGTQHELEHTSNEYIARLIALDHIAEVPDYYDQLAKFHTD